MAVDRSGVVWASEETKGWTKRIPGCAQAVGRDTRCCGRGLQQMASVPMFPDITLLAILFLSAIALVASVVGFVTTRVLALDWSARTGLADALVTIVICIACAWLLSVVQWEDVMVPISSSAVGVMAPLFSTARRCYAAAYCGTSVDAFSAEPAHPRPNVSQQLTSTEYCVGVVLPPVEIPVRVRW